MLTASVQLFPEAFDAPLGVTKIRSAIQEKESKRHDVKSRNFFTFNPLILDPKKNTGNDCKVETRQRKASYGKTQRRVL
jgi:hypothetical protein